MKLAIVQARMSSTRLPGKVVAPVLGVPMILRQLERIARADRIDQVVVATSRDASDDELVAMLTTSGVIVRRGSLSDVAARFESVIDEFQPETVVRLTADCPLCDPDVIDRVIDEHLASEADYSSNVIERTFPQGLDVECVTADAFRRMIVGGLDAEEREHVTLALYRNPARYSLHSVMQDKDLSRLRWTVDRPDDLEFVRSVYQELYASQPDFRQRDILDLIRRRPDLEHVN